MSGAWQEVGEVGEEGGGTSGEGAAGEEGEKGRSLVRSHSGEGRLRRWTVGGGFGGRNQEEEVLDGNQEVGEAGEEEEETKWRHRKRHKSGRVDVRSRFETSCLCGQEVDDGKQEVAAAVVAAEMGAGRPRSRGRSWRRMASAAGRTFSAGVGVWTW